MPVESPEICITVYLVYFYAATKTSSNLTKTANTNYLPFRVFRHLKIATTSYIFNKTKDMLFASKDRIKSRGLKTHTHIYSAAM